MATEKRLIDANAFWESVSTDYWEHFTQCHTTDQIDLMEMIKENLAEQPTVDAVEVVHGRWVKHPKPVYMCGDLFYRYECSNCGRDRFVKCSDDHIYAKYCEECGAKMDGDGNE